MRVGLGESPTLHRAVCNHEPRSSNLRTIRADQAPKRVRRNLPRISGCVKQSVDWRAQHRRRGRAALPSRGAPAASPAAEWEFRSRPVAAAPGVALEIAAQAVDSIRRMLALTAAPGLPGNVELREVPEPSAAPDHAIVRVHAFSLNRGETRRLAQMKDGELTGWDVAGVVEQAAANGTGPQAGSRVVGLTAQCGWAQLAPVDVEVLTQLPDCVSDAQAATLPVAGLTALKALDMIGSVLARRLLVTGASGGLAALPFQAGKARRSPGYRGVSEPGARAEPGGARRGLHPHDA